MVFTDTHTHIYYVENRQEQEAMMDRCFNNSIHRLFLPNVDVRSLAMIDSMVAAYPENCFAMAGLHPCDVKEGFELELNIIREHINHRNIYAIGEIGIDLHWDKTTFEIQKLAFLNQIQWAIQLDLPIIIHCREAFDEVFEVLESEKNTKLRGIFHCFTGDKEQALRAIALGFSLGIGGVVTYKNSGLDATLQFVPIDKIVLETDSPYLAPVPFRGKSNESSYLIYIAQKVADIYGLSIADVAEITTNNSKDIFKV